MLRRLGKIYSILAMMAIITLFSLRSVRADLYVLQQAPPSDAGFMGARSTGLASNGLITGYLYDVHSHPFGFLSDPSTIGLSSLGPGPAGTGLWGQGINRSKHIDGFTFPSSGSPVEGFYAASAQLADQFLVPSPFGGKASYLVGLSDRLDRHNVADYAGFGEDANGVFHGFGYSAASGGAVYLPEPNTILGSMVFRVSNNGNAAGFWEDTSHHVSGLVWKMDSDFVEPIGAGPGGTFSELFGVSATGKLFCGAADDSVGNLRAALWDKMALSLGAPSDTNGLSVDIGWGVNSAGRMVGQGYGQIPDYNQGTYAATIWVNGQPVDLNTITVFPDGNPVTDMVNLRGWDSSGIPVPGADINDAGQITCEAFRIDSAPPVYLPVRLDPVGPASLSCPRKAHGGSIKIKVSLNMPAPIDTVVHLVSSDSKRLPVSDVTIPQGRTSATVKLRLLSGPHGASITVTGSETGLAASCTFTTP